jgi:hypothetical protein
LKLSKRRTCLGREASSKAQKLSWSSLRKTTSNCWRHSKDRRRSGGSRKNLFIAWRRSLQRWEGNSKSSNRRLRSRKIKERRRKLIIKVRNCSRNKMKRKMFWLKIIVQLQAQIPKRKMTWYLWNWVKRKRQLTRSQVKYNSLRRRPWRGGYDIFEQGSLPLLNVLNYIFRSVLA